MATVTCDTGATLEGCNTMKCDANGAWTFHECADPARREGDVTDSTACYGPAIDAGDSISPTKGDDDGSTDDNDAEKKADTGGEKSVEEDGGNAYYQ